MGPNQTYKLLHSKENHQHKMKRQTRNWERTLAKTATYKRLISKIYKLFI